LIAGEITLVRPLDEISAITHIGDPVLLTVIAEEVKVARNEPPAMASTVQPSGTQQFAAVFRE